jgi:hypothetical protein
LAPVPTLSASNLIGSRLRSSGITRAWVGISDLTTEGSYRTLDNRAISFTRWATGEPTGAAAATEDCIEIDTSGRWYDSVCTVSKPFVCARAPRIALKEDDSRRPPPVGQTVSIPMAVFGAVVGVVMVAIVTALVVKIRQERTRSAEESMRLRDLEVSL